MKKIQSLKLKGYSLTELLFVLVIIGILLLVAIPNLMPLIARTHSIEAQQALVTISKLQKSYHQLHVTYSDDLIDLGYEPEKLVQEGGNAKYKIQILSSGPSSFVAKATAVVDFDQDGIFNEWEIDNEGKLIELVKD